MVKKTRKKIKNTSNFVPHIGREGESERDMIA